MIKEIKVSVDQIVRKVNHEDAFDKLDRLVLKFKDEIDDINSFITSIETENNTITKKDVNRIIAMQQKIKKEMKE